MFRFENQSVLYFLILIAVFIVCYIFFQIKDRKRLEKYCDDELLKKLTPQRSQGMKHLKFSLLMLALTFFIIAAANPQTAGKVEKVKRQGVDIMLCLDVSNSMLAADIQPNRLSACKMAINRFIDKLQGDRVGLVVFAGKAFVQLPITTDYAAAKMFVNQIDTKMMPVQGTDIAAALETAANALSPADDSFITDTKENKTSKVILLASDGEDHYPESIEMAEELGENGFIIHTIGIGSTKGVPIPNKLNGTQFKKDKDGNTVITRLNEQILKTIANKGKGTYVHANNANMGFENILNEINAMDKSEIEDMNYTYYQSLYLYPLLIGFILLFIDSLLFTSKPKLKDWINRTRRQYKVTSILLCLVSILCLTSCKDKTRPSVIQEANSAFAEGDSLRSQNDFVPDTITPFDTTGNYLYTTALNLYDSAAVSEMSNYNEAKFNQIAAHYRLNNFDTISHLADTLSQTSIDKNFIAQVLYNKGNAYMQQQQYGAAIEAYKSSLRNNPNDMDAKYNLVYAQKMAKNHGNGQGAGQNSEQKQQDQQNKQNQGNDGNDQNKEQQNKNQDNKQQQRQQGSQGDKKEKGEESAAQREQRAAMMRQLDALQQNERQTQQKMMIEKSKEDKNQNRNKQEKDW